MTIVDFGWEGWLGWEKVRFGGNGAVIQIIDNQELFFEKVRFLGVFSILRGFPDRGDGFKIQRRRERCIADTEGPDGENCHCGKHETAGSAGWGGSTRFGGSCEAETGSFQN